MGHDFWSPWIDENFGETKDYARLQSNFEKSNDGGKYALLRVIVTIMYDNKVLFFN